MARELNVIQPPSSGSSDAVVQTISLGGGVFDTPAYFNSSIYYAAAGDVLAALRRRSMAQGLQAQRLLGH